MLGLLMVSLCLQTPLDVAVVERMERLGAEGQLDAAYLPQLVPSLKSSDLHTRGLAALAISRHVPAVKDSIPPQVVAGLIDRLDDDNPHVVGLCRRSLATLGPLAVPELSAWLANPMNRSVRERKLAVEASRLLLHERRLPELEPVLWVALRDPDAGVAERVRVTIAGWVKVSAKEPFRNVKLLRETAQSPNPEIRDLAFDRLELLKAEAFPVLLALTERGTRELRHESLRRMGQMVKRDIAPTAAEAQTMLRLLDLEPAEDLPGVRQALAKFHGPDLTFAGGAARRVEDALRDWTSEKADRQKLLLALRDEAGAGLRALEGRAGRSDRAERRAALEVLAELRDIWQPDSLTANSFALSLYDLDDPTALAAAAALRAAARPDLHASPLLLDALAAALRDPDARLRTHAIHALAGFGEQAEETLLPLFRDRDTSVRRSALATAKLLHENGTVLTKCLGELARLANRKEEAAVTLLTGLQALSDLNADEPARRQRGLRAIERLGTEGHRNGSYLPGLAKMLQASDLPTRGLAALALARHAPAAQASLPSTVPLELIANLHDDNAHVRAYCRAALRSLGPTALPAVRHLLAIDGVPGSEASRQDGLQACRVLMAVPACQVEVETLLWQTLLDENAAVAEQARVELIALRDEHHLPPFALAGVIAGALESDSKRIQRLARSELLTLRERAVPALVRLLGSSKVSPRDHAAEILLELLQSDLVPATGETAHLVVLLSSPDLPEWKELRARIGNLAKKQVPPALVEYPEVESDLNELRKPQRDWDAVLPRLRALGPKGILALERRLILQTEGRDLVMESLLRLREYWTPSSLALETLAVELYASEVTRVHGAAITLRYCMKPSLPAPRLLLDALSHGLVHDNRAIREYCSQALAACGPRAEQHLIRLLRGDNERGQFQAAVVVHYMGRVHQMTVSPALKEAVDRPKRLPEEKKP